jgi:DNA polymerase
LIAAVRQVKTPMVDDMMDDRPNRGFDEELTAALDWWREAGVDCDYADEPVNWLAKHETEPSAADASPQPAFAPVVHAPATPPLVMTAEPPKSHREFVDWWLSEPSLDQGRVSDRVPPRGPVGAELMVLVAHPEREDTTRLLSGPQGRLLDAMLAAMGSASDAAYVASVLPRHLPHADWQAIAASGFGQVTSHHVKIAAPRRLIVFGNNILPLLGHAPANNGNNLPKINHESGSVALLSARELAALLERPRWKAGFWQDWLDWAD